MIRRCFFPLVVFLLTGFALAGVVENPEDAPRAFEDGPPTGIYKKERARPKVTSQTSSNGSLKAAAEANAPVMTKATALSQQGKTSLPAGEDKPEELVTNQEATNPKTFPAVPGGGETWPLLAIAVLLLVFAGLGGYYFYARQEE